jgi:small-conductance mechanosensitive channel
MTGAMRSERTALLLIAVMISLVIAVPLFSENAEGQLKTVSDVDIGWPASYDVLDIRAGESKIVPVHLINTSVDVRYVEVTGSSFSRGTIEILNGPIPKLDGAGGDDPDYVLSVKISVNQYSGSVKDIIVGITFLVYYHDLLTADFVENSVTLNWTVHISSGRASENQHNKIMGFVNNPFPAPFDIAIYAAAATFMIWLGIAVFASLILLPTVIGLVLRKHSKEDNKKLASRIKKELLLLIMLYGVTASVAVTGVSEQAIQTLETVAFIIYILVGLQIVWRIFVAVLDAMQKRKLNGSAMDEDEPDDSMKPLILMIGKIVMGMVAAAAMLSVLGLDTMFIATGAGIVGLAISFGAQSTLAQFFSGFTLLLNRPLRPGDLVRIEMNPDTLRVINVGFMMTTFRNWANSEIITMPNQKVVSSTITNVTAESYTYRIVVLVKVPYTSDVMLAKTLALESMREHPRILQDGTEEIPKVRFEEFSDSSLTIRVSGFVDDFEDHRSIAGEIRESIYRKFKENDITIAIPKMDVYIRHPGSDKEEQY